MTMLRTVQSRTAPAGGRSRVAHTCTRALGWALAVALAWAAPAGPTARALAAEAGATTTSSAGTGNIPFRVFAADGKTLLYTGEYLVSVAGGRRAETQRYLGLDGKLVKLDESVFDTEHRRPVSYYSANQLTGEALRVAVQGDTISIQAEDLKGAVKSRGEDTLPPGTFIWPNLSAVLAGEWERLAGGKPVELELFIMTRKMRISLDLTPEGTVDVGGQAGVRVKAVPASYLLRALAPASFLTLSVEPPHRFLKFEGQGAIKDADGKDVNTVIVFDWAQAKL